ncbi:MAG: histidine triad nucleotide-binding protein [Eubacteriales bacterium]|nr:histidine triad nucleotide-binding protein [Eubacteriales bacterium]
MNDCLFCKIISGDIPSNKAYEDEKVLAFYDIAPQAPVHILIIPKEHIGSAQELSTDNNELLGHMFAIARKLASEKGLDCSGYRLVTNVGDDAGQSVKHLHLHLIGGKTLKWDN